MDGRILESLLNLSEDINICLNSILSCQSMKQLLPSFKDFTVKLLQFSSIIQQIQKISRTELERESIALLLKSLKSDISELSNSSQAFFKSKRSSSRKSQQENVVSRIQYSVMESLKIVQRIQKSEISQMRHENRSLSQCKDRPMKTESELSTYLCSKNEASISQATTPSLGHRTDFGYDDQSSFDEDCSVSASFQSLRKIGSTLKSQAAVLLDKLLKEDKFGSSEISFHRNVLEGCRRFTSQVEKFCQVVSSHTREDLDADPDIQFNLGDIKDVAKDFASVVIKCSQSGFDEGDINAANKLKSTFDKRLSRIVEDVECSIRGSDMVSFDESLLKTSMHQMKSLVKDKNLIGLVDVTTSFIDKVRKAERFASNMIEEKNLSQEARIFSKKVQQARSDFEECVNDVILDVDNLKAVYLLEEKMQNIFALLTDLHEALETPSQPHGSLLDVGAEVHKPVSGIEEVVLAKNEELQHVTKSEPDKGHGRSDDELAPFFVGIVNHDYRTVERRANVLMDAMKRIGSTLLKVSTKSFPRIRDLHQAYQDYHNLAGHFCSQARKFVLSDVDGEAIADLKRLGDELIQKRIDFIESCKVALRPWIDIPLLAIEGLAVEKESRGGILMQFTSRINKVIETLNATEYFGNHKQREEIMNLKKLVLDLTSEISSFQKSSKQQTDNLNYCAINWACAVISIVGILDRLVSGHKVCSLKSKRKQFALECDQWISITDDLAFGCSDEEVCSEISDGVNELRGFTEKLTKFQGATEKDGITKQLDLLLLKWEIPCKIILLAELTDVLTRDVSEPMKSFIDPLASLSFASSLACYKELEEAFLSKMESVETMACLAVEDSPSKTESHLAFQSIDELMRVSNELLNVVSQPRHSVGKSLELLKLRWRTKASYLIKVLMSVPEVKFTAVAGVMRHLQSASHVGHLDELVEILRDEGSPLRPYSQPQGSAESFYDDVADDTPTEQDSLLSSGFGYPTSGDTDILPNLFRRSDFVEPSYFLQFEDAFQEENTDQRCSVQSPESFHPLSSSISTRPCSSQTQDTGTFIARPSANPCRSSSRQDMRSDINRSSCSSQTQDTEIFIGRQSLDSSSSSRQVSRSVVDKNSPKSAHTYHAGYKHVKTWPREQTMKSFMSIDDSKISKSIAAAAEILRREVGKWEEDGNSVVTVVKQMSEQMLQMADYARGKGRLRSKQDFINTAKAIAANAKMVAKFAVIIADHCLDKTCQLNLFHYSELVPTISTQLKIIASVKAATPDDETADTMLIGNAENLMKYVLATLKAAEAASVTLKKDESTPGRGMRIKSTALTLQWKRKHDFQRTLESFNAPTNDLGLKILSNSPALSIADL